MDRKIDVAADDFTPEEDELHGRFSGTSEIGSFDEALTHAVAFAKQGLGSDSLEWELVSVKGRVSEGVRAKTELSAMIEARVPRLQSALVSNDRPKFSKLSQSYPDPPFHDNCPDVQPKPNLCAVRLSHALTAANAFEPSEFDGNLCRHNYARGASDLAAYLTKKWGRRDDGWPEPGSPPAGIKRKKGVILFERIPGFSGQGHIDLWDGEKTKTGEYWNAKTVWFWQLVD